MLNLNKLREMMQTRRGQNPDENLERAFHLSCMAQNSLRIAFYLSFSLPIGFRYGQLIQNLQLINKTQIWLCHLLESLKLILNMKR